MKLMVMIMSDASNIPTRAKSISSIFYGEQYYKWINSDKKAPIKEEF